MVYKYKYIQEKAGELNGVVKGKEQENLRVIVTWQVALDFDMSSPATCKMQMLAAEGALINC